MCTWRGSSEELPRDVIGVSGLDPLLQGPSSCVKTGAEKGPTHRPGLDKIGEEISDGYKAGIHGDR